MEGYDASQIQILEGLKAVRKVPGMYIGSTDVRGLHHLVYEVLDNSIDESVAGYCKNISIVICNDGSISIEDDGRGIPIDIHPKYNRPGLEIVLTELHSGAKFDKKVYKITGGLHGVGVHVVNALSSTLLAIVKRNDGFHFERFAEGIPTGKLEYVEPEIWGHYGQEDLDSTPVNLARDHGLIIKFYPDSTIFETTEFSYRTILERVKELAFLNPQVTLSLLDERTGEHETLHFEGGLLEFVDYLGVGHKSLLKSTIHDREESDKTIVEFAFTYNSSTSEITQSYVNNISTIEGGTHVTGFRIGLSRAIQDFAKNNDLIKGVEKITGEDCREGLVAVIHAKVYEPQFEGQTKSKLGNSGVRGTVQSVTEKYLKSYFERFPNVANTIVSRVLLAATAREASRNAKELIRRKSALESGNLPGKLADCSISDPSRAEVYIVEGNSAGGSAKQARNREFQAILPLRGKILNVEKATDIRTLSNEEIRNLITIMGTNVKDDLDISKLRYGKVIIMTDADVDGAHIRTLLLTFFYRFAREIIQNGNLYIAQPPLYRVQKGSRVEYVYSERELAEVQERIGQSAVVQRFKGLGEMNPSQLWETTMNPETRKLLQVTIEDVVSAERLLSILMGEKVQPRREFIEENAKTVENIDV